VSPTEQQQRIRAIADRLAQRLAERWPVAHAPVQDQELWAEEMGQDPLLGELGEGAAEGGGTGELPEGLPAATPAEEGVGLEPFAQRLGGGEVAQGFGEEGAEQGDAIQAGTAEPAGGKEHRETEGHPVQQLEEAAVEGGETEGQGFLTEGRQPAQDTGPAGRCGTHRGTFRGLVGLTPPVSTGGAFSP